MAECGATGSTIDRSAARIISSAIGGGQNNATGDAAARAGKALGSFLGTASVPASAASTAGALMPSAPPNYLYQPSINIPVSGSMMNHQSDNRLGLREGGVQAVVGGEIMENNRLQVQHSIGGRHTNHHPYAHQNHAIHMQQQHHAQIQADMHMQMNMNMMNQQMAMMQMAQMQKQQQQQNLQHKNQAQDHIVKDKSHVKSKNSINEIENNETVHEHDINEWHEHLEDEFESYLGSYRQDILNNQTDDVASTTENVSDIGHEGYVEGASIEKLAAAWAESEAEHLDKEDYLEYYSNIAEPYANDLDEMKTHYEFSEMSQTYGQQQQRQRNMATEYTDLMSEGMKLFNNGKTNEAILCFESQLRNVDPDSSDAWYMLGRCNAENDEDRKAIACLENAVQRDPYSTEALLALGVSYVNELNYEESLKHLNNWVTHNPNLEVSVQLSEETSILENVKSLLNNAKQYSEANGDRESTADVLTALGVLYNVTREYDDAIDCFELATKMRPSDYQLWNKLGATLANNKRSEEAHHAYHKALSIKPKYARAWLNMAIAHSNLNSHDEAARCYLQTLSLNPAAVHIWSYLRISLTCSERWDLLPLCASQNISAFKEHFDFIQH
mmetsp:Transcript_31033/g.36211  ORF Transcript_31033/g.36211 Transcript_31033/m.36211 type:complete len:615 (+) Transcript_31033:108-1952(+)